MNSIVNGLESSSVFYFFEEISKIPRGSGNEKQISNYIVEFAKKRGLWVHQDKSYNVIIKKPATVGNENAPTIIMQSHIDMVCEKNKDSNHDFFKDPIKLIYEEDFLRADGTTLGADDGIGVAFGLSLLDSRDIVHPPLEVVFTADEEVGMCGTKAIDGSLFDGKILINIDSEDEGIFTVGCAGGLEVAVNIPIEYVQAEQSFCFYNLSLTGLKGGHSGIDITKERANSNILLARLLSRLYNDFNICVHSVSGGAKSNAIPRESEALISFDNLNYDKILNTINDLTEELKNEFRNTDKELEFKLLPSDKSGLSFSDDTLKKYLSAVLLIPNGVITMSTDIKGLPESSNNLGVVRIENSHISLISAVRSSVVSKKYFINDKIKKLAELINAECITDGDYPAWEYKADSYIRDLFVSVYNDVYNQKPILETIHAGLECGLFAKKIENVDMISFGPSLYDVHTPNEKASISSIERTWKFFIRVLKEIK